MTSSHQGESREKRKKGDRVNLDVGGQKFVSAVSTLTSESSYFCSQFSEHWYDDDQPCFVDQDPESFDILLDFMRSGMIRVQDITHRVLTQAIFLGMDRLLTAVKVRAYRKLHPLDEPISEEEAPTAFDKEFGGIVEAISSGVLPDALTLEPEPKKEYATIMVRDLAICAGITTSEDNETDLSITENRGIPLLGALNKLYFHGFTTFEAKTFHGGNYVDIFTFSRRIPQKQDESTKLFIDSASAGRTEVKKTLALNVDNTQGESLIYYAPKNYSGDDESDKWSSEERDRDVSWLVQRSYVQREEELERLFSAQFSDLAKFTFRDAEEKHRRVQIFSRTL